MLKASVFSFFYRLFRRLIITCARCYRLLKKQQTDLEDAVHIGDALIKKTDPVFGKTLSYFPIPKNIGVSVYDLYFPSPLTVASFKEDVTILSYWFRMGMGGGILKTIMKEERKGNPRPRLQEVRVEPKGLLNAMGLPGVGLYGLIDILQTTPLYHFERPIGISIGGNTIQEYKDNFLTLFSFVKGHFFRHFFFELNISCPNTPEGQDMSKHPSLFEELLRFIRSHSSHVVSVKVSPDQSLFHLRTLAEICRGFPKMVLNIGNSIYKTCEECGLPKEAISIGGGGYTGAGLFPKVLELTGELSSFEVPILATGGISTRNHILALKEKGAVLFGMATSLVQDPYRVPILNEQLENSSLFF